MLLDDRRLAGSAREQHVQPVEAEVVAEVVVPGVDDEVALRPGHSLVAGPALEEERVLDVTGVVRLVPGAGLLDPALLVVAVAAVVGLAGLGQADQDAALLTGLMADFPGPRRRDRAASS